MTISTKQYSHFKRLDIMRGGKRDTKLFLHIYKNCGIPRIKHIVYKNTKKQGANIEPWRVPLGC